MCAVVVTMVMMIIAVVMMTMKWRRKRTVVKVFEPFFIVLFQL